MTHPIPSSSHSLPQADTLSLPTPIPADASHSTVYMETFGCQMNVLDSQLVRSQLQAAGYRFIDHLESADIVLYNTCSVREHAESKVYSRLGVVAQLKKQKPHIVLGVLGCMAERDGLDLLRRYPQVDLLCGPGELDKVPLLIDNTRKTQPDPSSARKRSLKQRQANSALQGNTHRRSSTFSAAEDQLELLDLSRAFSPDDHQGSAYVRITRGCNKFCTYCVVPNTRGPEIHRPPDHILQECQKLVDSGVLEITLLGQTVNHYHYDHNAAVTLHGIQQPQIGAPVHHDGPAVSSSNFTTFAQLLQRIHDQIPQLPRLRFVTSFPRDFGDDILHTIAACPRICQYIHLPVQSGSDRILKAMNRGYAIDSYRQLLSRIRQILPDALLCTDIICGFPGETDADHQATLDLLREARFKNAFIFKYSPRPGTAAYTRLPDDVPEEVKRHRNNQLLTLQSEISAAIHQTFVGKTVQVLVESVSEHAQRSRDAALPGSASTITLGWEKPQTTTQLTGRTPGDLIVCFQGPSSLVGKIVPVHIDRAAPLVLFGTAL